MDIRRFAVRRCEIEFEITCEYNVAWRSLDHDPHGIRYAVGCSKEADAGFTEFDDRIFIDFVQDRIPE
ncbi:hypothetical protein SDC9_75357 [bioreactor metagenome]|uniref:Uncharacterized protein n=1 Tax=bioreactor metagenome TaxID=1076179 RepID=A0A644YK09_9ZZZZ